MGMSGDFALAIEEGATRIRVGTALFGKRAPYAGGGMSWRCCARCRGSDAGGAAQPGAKKTAVVGVYGEGAAAQLKIAVQAPPIEGRANSAVIAFLAEMFSVSRSSVELISWRVVAEQGVSAARNHSGRRSLIKSGEAVYGSSSKISYEQASFLRVK